MTTTLQLTWKRSTGTYTGTIYTGTIAGSSDYYAVSRRGRRWECWIVGQYLGAFKTMKLAKEAAGTHLAGR